jgi:hypothetical protein
MNDKNKAAEKQSAEVKGSDKHSEVVKLSSAATSVLWAEPTNTEVCLVCGIGEKTTCTSCFLKTKAAEKQQPSGGWKEYHDENPRAVYPDDLTAFKDYAKRRYLREGKFVVNHCHCDDEEEVEFEVENYIGESAELLMLYREFSPPAQAQPCQDCKQLIASYAETSAINRLEMSNLRLTISELEKTA